MTNSVLICGWPVKVRIAYSASVVTQAASPARPSIVASARFPVFHRTAHTATTIQLEPLLGASIDVTRSVSLLPKVLLNYTMTSFTSLPSSTGWSWGATVPLVLHVPYLFVSVGPIVFFPISDTRRHDLGVRTLIGAWF